MSSMYTLGINAAFHDSSATLVKDGMVLSAAEEERFTKIKHGKRPTPFAAYELPFHAIDFCLNHAGITLGEIDHIAYSYNPEINLGKFSKETSITLPLEPSGHTLPGEWENVWDPLMLSSIVNAPRHLTGGVPHHLQKNLKSDSNLQWHFVEHHLAHAASAFLPSPLTEAAILTIDGRGEKATTTFNIGSENDIKRITQVDYPHSLGLLYEKMTQYLGFLPSSDEYKVMALASFGKPKFTKQFKEIIQIDPTGNYVIKPLDFANWFGPAREKGSPLAQKHFDIASSLQQALEKSVLQLTESLYKKTSQRNLCLAGGVALNCVMNSKILQQGLFKNIWIQPAAGDAGTSLGAALYLDARERKDRKRRYLMNHVYLGPQFSDQEIENFLKWSKLSYQKLTDIPKAAARLLGEDKIIGWFQGRMEFGPRALGARSILASPIHAKMQQRLNDMKDREDFRPVAPVVLEEEAPKWFKNTRSSSFMLFVYNILPRKKNKISAVKHIDGTARIQTINRKQNPLYYDVIKQFQTKTGVPVLVNTSFNTRGKPIVCTPQDALECFWSSPLDALVIGSYLLEKP